MKTTALSVELLIIGYQALTWLVLAICLFPQCDKTLLIALKDWKELLIIASIVAAYTSGAIINGAVSRVMQPLERKVIFKRSIKPSEMRASILVQKPDAFVHIIQNFDVPKVLRSTIFNIFLIGVFTFINLWAKSASCSHLLIVALLFVFGIICSAWAWYETAENFYIHLCKTYDALTKPSSSV